MRTCVVRRLVIIWFLKLFWTFGILGQSTDTPILHQPVRQLQLRCIIQVWSLFTRKGYWLMQDLAYYWQVDSEVDQLTENLALFFNCVVIHWGRNSITWISESDLNCKMTTSTPKARRFSEILLSHTELEALIRLNLFWMLLLLCWFISSRISRKIYTVSSHQLFENAKWLHWMLYVWIHIWGHECFMMYRVLCCLDIDHSTSCVFLFVRLFAFLSFRYENNPIIFDYPFLNHYV